jgi:hypothetical protein
MELEQWIEDDDDVVWKVEAQDPDELTLPLVEVGDDGYFDGTSLVEGLDTDFAGTLGIVLSHKSGDDSYRERYYAWWLLVPAASRQGAEPGDPPPAVVAFRDWLEESYPTGLRWSTSLDTRLTFDQILRRDLREQHAELIETVELASLAERDPEAERIDSWMPVTLIDQRIYGVYTSLLWSLPEQLGWAVLQAGLQLPGMTDGELAGKLRRSGIDPYGPVMVDAPRGTDLVDPLGGPLDGPVKVPPLYAVRVRAGAETWNVVSDDLEVIGRAVREALPALRSSTSGAG